MYFLSTGLNNRDIHSRTSHLKELLVFENSFSYWIYILCNKYKFLVQFLVHG
jgi:hypothetical protein